jgi:hypothetical protein
MHRHGATCKNKPPWVLPGTVVWANVYSPLRLPFGDKYGGNTGYLCIDDIPILFGFAALREMIFSGR